MQDPIVNKARVTKHLSNAVAARPLVAGSIGENNNLDNNATNSSSYHKPAVQPSKTDVIINLNSKSSETVAAFKSPSKFGSSVFYLLYRTSLLLHYIKTLI